LSTRCPACTCWCPASSARHAPTTAAPATPHRGVLLRCSSLPATRESFLLASAICASQLPSSSSQFSLVPCFPSFASPARWPSRHSCLASSRWGSRGWSPRASDVPVASSGPYVRHAIAPHRPNTRFNRTRCARRLTCTLGEYGRAPFAYTSIVLCAMRGTHTSPWPPERHRCFQPFCTVRGAAAHLRASSVRPSYSGWIFGTDQPPSCTPGGSEHGHGTPSGGVPPHPRGQSSAFGRASRHSMPQAVRHAPRTIHGALHAVALKVGPNRPAGPQTVTHLTPGSTGLAALAG